MLKGISPLLSPQLLKVLCEMGHGDEIVFADGGFPAERLGKNGIVIRADGVGTVPLLEAVLQLFPLDPYSRDHFVLMDVVPGDKVEPEIWNRYLSALKKADPAAEVTMLSRQSFYDRAEKAYAIVATGETAQYANIILKKGVVFRG